MRSNQQRLNGSTHWSKWGVCLGSRGRKYFREEGSVAIACHS